jgi:alginate O-acetyltransferase complex protein AlgI
MPYLARNIGDFWRRWHISLSSWLRDYVFFPLGGSRLGAARTVVNVFITLVLCGLWHGADWTYVVFGLSHATMLCGHRLFRSFADRHDALERWLRSPLGIVLSMALTFQLFCFTLILFRATTLAAAGVYFDHLFAFVRGPARVPVHPTCVLLAFLALALCHLGATQGWHRRLGRWPAPVLGFAYAALVTAVLLLAPADGKAFIYFQF